MLAKGVNDRRRLHGGNRLALPPAGGSGGDLDGGNTSQLEVLSYSVLSNHWHFFVWPEEDGQLTEFFRKLAHTNAMRWRVLNRTVGHAEPSRAWSVVSGLGQSGAPVRHLGYIGFSADPRCSSIRSQPMGSTTRKRKGLERATHRDRARATRRRAA
jgi:hypothetical protein